MINVFNDKNEIIKKNDFENDMKFFKKFYAKFF